MGITLKDILIVLLLGFVVLITFILLILGNALLLTSPILAIKYLLF